MSSELSDQVGEAATHEAKPAITHKPVTAMILSFVGGILILSLGCFNLSEIILGFGGLDGILGFSYGFLSLLCGIIVTVMPFALSQEPGKSKTCGLLIIMFSLLGLVSRSLGGAIIGSVLGTMGGVFAYRWNGTEANADPIVRVLERSEKRLKILKTLEDMDAPFLISEFFIIELMLIFLAIQGGLVLTLIVVIPLTIVLLAFAYVALWK